MQRLVSGCVSLLCGLAVLTPPATANCGQVEISEMNWVSARVVTAVSSLIMEKAYGCKVITVATTTTKVLPLVRDGGKPDIVTELWVNSAPGYRELEDGGKIVTLAKVLSDGGVEGWWIPKHLADQHPELRTIAGIVDNPKWVGGRFHNCPEGWGCRVINDNLVRAHGLAAKGIRSVNHKSGQALAASIASAFANKTAWFGYYWAPTPVIGKYPMVKVDIGPIDAAAHECNKKKDCAKPGKSAYPGSTVVTIATTAFVEREPQIAELMRKVSFTNNQMGKVLAWMQDKKAEPHEAARFFLITYRDVWRQWVPEAAAEKLQGALGPTQ